MSAHRFAMTALLVSLVLCSDGVRADPHVDVARVLQRALAAYERGDVEDALHAVRRAERALVAEQPTARAGALRNLDWLHEVLGVYGEFAYGNRVDLDATHDAVLRALPQIRRAYRKRPTALSFVRFDLEGRVTSIGSLDLDYEPFSDRLSAIGSIAIDYEPFSERPRSIGPIRFRWFFDELREVGGVAVR